MTPYRFTWWLLAASLLLATWPAALRAQEAGWAESTDESELWWERGESATPAPEQATAEPETDPEPPAEPGEASGPMPDESALADDAETFPRFAPDARRVGGFHYEDIQNRDEADERQDRLTTVALTRFGFQGFIGPHVSVLSELELNAGPHGTSVWEGQAALQIRNQLLRIDYEGLRVDVGRVTDPSSVDFFSAYVANLLLTDPLARFPLLVSGFNRGNGVLAQYEIIPGLRAGLTINAGNPTATTGTVMIGGTFPPFSRFYEVPASHVGRDAKGFPADSFHVILMSPHVIYEHDMVRAHASLQWFTVDTNTNSVADESIQGVNLRAGAQLRLFDDRLRPFLNLSAVQNDVVDPMSTDTLLNEQYEAQTVTGGVDFAIHGDSGVGAQYTRVRERQGDGTVIIRHYVNVGATWWMFDGLALDARAALYRRCDDDDCTADGQQSYWLTVRGVLGGVEETAQRRP